MIFTNMKRKQNILAENSSGEIAYLCGKCFKPVKKDEKICPNCNARLGDIRCPFCNFRGTVEDFKFDTCPKCGRKQKKEDSIKKAKKRFKIEKNEELNFNKKLFWLLFFILSFILMLIFIIIYAYYFK